jgi:long-chain acyl-CoA synthetase
MSTTEPGSQEQTQEQEQEQQDTQNQGQDQQTQEQQSDGAQAEQTEDRSGASAEARSQSDDAAESGTATQTQGDGETESQSDGEAASEDDTRSEEENSDGEAQGSSEPESEEDSETEGEGDSETEAQEDSEADAQEDSEAEGDSDEEESDEPASGADRGTRAKTLAEMVVKATSSHDGTALKFKTSEGEWDEVSYRELGNNVRAVAKGLIALGIEKGDKVAIFSDTRPDWTLCDLAVISIGGVVAPIYQTSSADEAKHVLSDSGSKLCFCERSEMVETAQEVRADCPDLEQLIVIEGDVDDTLSLNEVVQQGEDVDDEQFDERVESVSPEDLFTIVYTSGTTGPPKGCLLTHGNYRANLEMLEETADWGEDPVLLIFLPLAHVLTRILQMLAIDVGGTLAFWEQDKDKILDNLQEVEPTHFSAVPRIFEKIYGRATAEADGFLKEKAFWKAVEVGRKRQETRHRGEEPGPVLNEEYNQADKRVLSKVRDLFGGNLQFAATGAAPVQQEMLEFFWACDVLVLEGYGATETSAVATINQPDDFRFGTVGKALPGSEIKIADEDGEILIRGPHVFQGYHGMEDETKEDLDEEGWYHTGDVGELDDDGFLKITGRKKDIIVTSSGKNIASGYIENKIAASRWVSHAVVYGDDKPYLVALVTLDQEERDALLQEAGSSDGDDIANDDKVREEIQKAIDNANEDLARVEQVKKFTIVDRELSQEEGEITPTMKVKRNVVYDNYRDEFEGLYDEDDQG